MSGPTVTPYPDGTELTSTALTQSAIDTLVQVLTCGMIGITPPDDSLVRISWPLEGQPFVDSTDDVCFLRCVTEDEPYDKLRDRTRVVTTPSPPPAPVTYVWTYTRVWRVQWTFYGPSSTDRARAVRSALFQDYFADQLAASQLFPVPDPAAPVRLPEQMNAQWFERVDFGISMYEFVTETIAVPTVASVPVVIKSEDATANIVIT